MEPKISVIVPIYNAGRYLRQCFDSIIAQTFTDWECILVDDGSKDNSSSICDEYAHNDNRFKVFHMTRTCPLSYLNFFTKSENRTEYYRCAQYIRQIKNPRILNYKCYEFGLGMLAEALPACKRYALPYGYSNNDVLEQDICLQNKIPDFVIVEDVDADDVKKYGYVYLSNYTRFENTWNSHINFRLYGRPDFKINNAKIKVTNMDVLLKKKVKFLE